MQEVVACAHRHPPHGRGTVGMVQVHPNSRNVIPGRVKFSIDLRNASDALCDAMDADIRAVAAKLSAESGLPITIEQVSAYPAQPFHPDMIKAVAQATQQLGYSNMPAVSKTSERFLAWTAGSLIPTRHPHVRASRAAARCSRR